MGEDLIHNKEIVELMEILENMADEELSVELLKNFGELSRDWGRLMLNQDPNLTHQEWKLQCDEAKNKLEQLIAKIKDQGRQNGGF